MRVCVYCFFANTITSFLFTTISLQNNPGKRGDDAYDTKVFNLKQAYLENTSIHREIT